MPGKYLPYMVVLFGKKTHFNGCGSQSANKNIHDRPT
jgi:hypothetical protein